MPVVPVVPVLPVLPVVATVWWLMLGCASLSSCDDAALTPDRGGPFATVKGDVASGTDGGARDAINDAVVVGDGPRDVAYAGDSKPLAADGRSDLVAVGGASVSPNQTGGSSGGGPGGATGGGGATLQTCDQCEQENCSPGHNMLPDYITACHAPLDANRQPAKALNGPAAGTLRKDLCEAVLACIRQDPNKCVTWAIPTEGFEDVQPCWCGQGVSDDDCTGGKAAGPCKMQIENAAEITSKSSAGADVGQNFVDWQNYGIGAAVTLTSECDLVYCRVSCLGLAPPNSLRSTNGSGGGSAMGAGGTGGSTGTGGRATGTGGATASGGTGAGSGGRPGAGGASGSTGGSASGGAGVVTSTYDTCRACELTACPEFVKSCEQAPGLATAGPAVGTPRSTLCEAVVACVRATKCSVDGDVAPCYCGTADQSGPCQGGAGNGPCKAQIEAAAESTDAPVVTGERFTNPDPQNKMPYAIGFATDLIGCDGFSCADALCVSGDPVATGGSSGSGGASSGTGGAGLGTGGASFPGTGGGSVASGTGGGSAPRGTGGSGIAPASGGTTGQGAPTTVSNADFDRDASSWQPEFGMSAVWMGNLDARANPSSGALGVVNGIVADAEGSTMGGVRQCVQARPSSTYAPSADVYIASGQGQASAGLSLLFYASTDCSGPIDGGATSTLTSTVGAWASVNGVATAPPLAHSMAVRLVVIKTFRAAAFQATFDAVAVTER